MIKPIAVVAVCLCAASGAWAQDEHVGIRLREWYAELHGSVSGDSSTIPGSTVDLGDDLGLDAPKWSPEIQVYGHIPFFGKLYAGWWRVDRDGDETLTRTITFAGQTYTASTRVESEVKLDVGYLTYEFDFPAIPLGDLLSWEIGLQLGARVMRGEGSINSAIASGSDDGIIGTPVLGGHMALKIASWVRVDVELVGLGFSYSGHRGTYLEGYGEVTVEPLPWIFAGFGYKYVAIFLKDSVGDSNFDLDIHLNGFYLTAGVRF